jgi:DNA topoisomerase I
MNVVVVESPAKAKTINKYLGSDFTVLSSYGHVRDLPSKDGSVDPKNGFSMKWEMDTKSRTRVREIAKALKGADHLYLATDPDREGEAIAWHVKEVLDQGKSLKGVSVKRIVFNEITKKAILEAFEHPRDLNQELVNAYLARRALDYLVGFTLSPVLWRKLPGSRSAGRVQSVALRLICDREMEIEAFKPQEYWSVKADFRTEKGEPFTALLNYLEGKKLTKMSLADNHAADAAVKATKQAQNFSVAKIERKKTRRNPYAPFTTSTLQQEASRKLYFSTKRTMQVAQKLYEGVSINGETVGLITYMRTDSVQMAHEAIAACRNQIVADFGEAYLPKSPRMYKTKAKNAQEAHEAIRPTDLSRRPKDITRHLDNDQKRLYELIWKRAVASQMESAVIDQVAATIAPSSKESVSFQANGSTVAFDGFLRLYREDLDDAPEKAKDDDKDRRLPTMAEKSPLENLSVTPEQHFTQPPPRYGEASLVKRLEELGIGRPSTYASIISVLQDRDYVVLEKRRFLPEDRGRLVTAFLASFFSRYVEYDFTADLEEKLDDISGGSIDWKKVLDDFWAAFSASVDDTKDLRVREVLDTLNDILGPHFFPETTEGGGSGRACPGCDDGQLSLKLGKFGAFIGCSNYPECRHTRRLVAVNGNGEQGAEAASTEPKVLGTDSESGLIVTLRSGPYGTYVQLGEAKKGDKKKPKRSSIPKTTDQSSLTLETALALLSLPRDVGVHPETNEIIKAGLGRFGPYLNHGGVYLSLKGDDDVLEIGLNRAVTLIAEAPKKAPPKLIGNHPKDGKPVTQRDGRWGPYVQHGSVRANLPKTLDEKDLTLEVALELIGLKAKKGKAAPAKAKKKAPAKAKKKKAAAKSS